MWQSCVVGPEMAYLTWPQLVLYIDYRKEPYALDNQFWIFSKLIGKGLSDIKGS